MPICSHPGPSLSWSMLRQTATSLPRRSMRALAPARIFPNEDLPSGWPAPSLLNTFRPARPGLPPIRTRVWRRPHEQQGPGPAIFRLADDERRIARFLPAGLPPTAPLVRPVRASAISSALRSASPGEALTVPVAFACGALSRPTPPCRFRHGGRCPGPARRRRQRRSGSTRPGGVEEPVGVEA